MKKIKIVSLLLVFVIAGAFLFTGETAHTGGPFKYVGAVTCAGACHKTDAQGKTLEIWQNSKHSQAFKNLQTPEADKIAKDKGFTTPAAETPECLKCRVLGKDIDISELETTFNKEDGVQCESCHGPGSEYKKLSIMKDRNKSVENGLIIHTEGDAFCTGCHNTESPTFKGFSYDEYWAKIKHNRQ